MLAPGRQACGSKQQSLPSRVPWPLEGALDHQLCEGRGGGQFVALGEGGRNE